MINTARTFTILVEGVSFTAAVAALVSGVLMYEITKKFGSGILASGFRTISVGVILLAIGITIDALSTYLGMESNLFPTGVFVLIKALCFVAGTYIIVIGTKRIADKLEKLTK